MSTEQKTQSAKLTNIIDVLELCVGNNLPAEIVGKYVWVTFDDKPDKIVREILKGAGFYWSKRRLAWMHPCGNRSTKPATRYHPIEKYGSVTVDQDVVAARQAI